MKENNLEVENLKLKRELEVEATLERVRSKTMAMQKSNQLGMVVAELYQQFKTLDFSSIGMELILCNKEKQQLEFWTPTFLKNIPEECFYIDKDCHSFFKKQWKAWEDRSRLYIKQKGKAKLDFENFIFENTDFKKMPVASQNEIKSSELAVFSHVTMKYGLLEAVDDAPLTEENMLVLQRFANVFEQSYTRFLDLQKAEAQAREARIEAALERVRAASMAMYHSDDLAKTIEILFNELNNLGIDAESSWVSLINEKESNMEVWLTHNGVSKTAYMTAENAPNYKNELKAWEGKVPFLKIQMNQEDFTKDLKAIFDIKIKASKKQKTFHLLQIRHRLGYMGLGTWLEATDEEFSILKRFTKIFEQTYTRFLDLQKAEAQAREAQIEAALEKVRSRSLAMHKPEELQEVVAVVAEKLKELGVIFDAGGVILCTYFPDNKDVMHWITVPDFSSSGSYLVPYFDNPIFNDAWDSKEKGDTFFSKEFAVEAKNDFFNHAFENSDYRHFPDDYKQFVLQADKHRLSAAWSKNSAIIIPSLTGAVPSESEAEIMKRFANVFEQSYIRFLDLQKAEEQTKEAKIETALEKVRASAMAMHKGDQLASVVEVVFEQFKILEFELQQIVISIFDSELNNVEWWSLGFNEKDMLKPLKVNLEPVKNHPYFKLIEKNFKDGSDFLTYKMEGRNKEIIDEFLFSDTDLKYLPEVVKAQMKGQESIVLSDAFLKHGIIEVAGPGELPEDKIIILKRFAKVIDLAYTRMLDIQNAEEKAREAQIEAALERVRSRAMGMHSSEELFEIVAKVFSELSALDLSLTRCTLFIIDPVSKSSRWWMANPEKAEEANSFLIPYHKKKPYLAMLDAWENKTKRWEYVLEGKDKSSWDDYIFVKSELSLLPQAVREGMRAPERIIMSANWSNFGGLSTASLEPLSSENTDLLERFCQVFDMSYTRFNDLKKAEAQTKEAQIEVALERIRASAMAMQSSDDLINVSKVLREQMSALGQAELESSVVYLFHPKTEEIEVWYAYRSTKQGSGEMVTGSGTGDKNIAQFSRDMWDYYHSERNEYTLVSKGKDLKEWYEILASMDTRVVDFDENNNILIPEKLYYHFSKFSGGTLGMIAEKEPSEEAKILQKRAASVFDMAYRRFLDLQNAEAQTKEAQIEVALERIRASAMAMQSSEGLQEVAQVLTRQLKALGQSQLDSCVIHQYNVTEKRILAWYSFVNQNTGEEVQGEALIESITTFTEREMWSTYLSDKQEYTIVSDRRSLKEWYSKLEELVPQILDYDDKGEIITPEIMYYHYAKFTGGCLLMVTNNKPEDESKDLLKRAAITFDLAYRRYLDLKKAEAQAREAQIEVALERIRASAMAMQTSEGLQNVASVLFQQLNGLGQSQLDSCIIQQYNSIDESMIAWYSFANQNTGEEISGEQLVKEISTIHERITLDAYLGQEMEYTIISQGKELKGWYEKLAKMDPRVIEFDNSGQIIVPEIMYYHHAKFTGGSLLMITKERPKEESKSLLKRAAETFDMAYRRYLDLQKAEAQAREAQIEVALERIRASAMAMQSSEDLFEVSQVLRTQMDSLGQEDLESAIVHLYEKKEIKAWYAYSPPNDESADVLLDVAYIHADSCSWTKALMKKYYSKESEYTIKAEGEMILGWYNQLKIVAPATLDYDKKGKMIIPDVLYYHFSKFSGGSLLMIANQEPSEESKELQKRAASVFDMAYRRFLDLKKAESQAQQAKIETALERVRAASMAMHQSSGLADTAQVLFKQLEFLGIETFATGFNICSETSPVSTTWMCVLGEIQKPLLIPNDEDPSLNRIYENWEKGSEIYVEKIDGEAIEKHYDFMTNIFSAAIGVPVEMVKNGMDLPENPKSQVFNAAYFKFGYLMFITFEENKELESIFIRFAAVFEQAYIRFMDLQKVEKQAHQAKVETALERVRARALAMQDPKELKEVAQVLRDEMGSLGIEELESSTIFIQNEATGKTDTWLAIEDPKQKKKKMVSDHFKLDLSQTWVGCELIKFQDSKKNSTSIPVEGKRRAEWVDYCHSQSDVFDHTFTDKLPDQNYHLFKFSNGAIAITANGEISKENWKLLGRVSSVFSLAYSRFKDLTKAKVSLQKLKEAKLKAENALVELKDTQTQLIQSEKMASLGELTAGIAHEIQNPLNFVNNFSEVSEELIEEVLEEREKALRLRSGTDDAHLPDGQVEQDAPSGSFGDDEELVDELLGDIKENLIKINHHGNRASSIVRGMLEHSRTSSAEKVPTDINVLADEYLRLAYHGLRAKDKSFNADFKTDFDENLPKINVIPQDLGRVLLNLVNNGFQAIDEKSKKGIKDFKPTLIITTKIENDNVIISIKDNGSGIPSEIKDKIFQPFFTTKPTGQGTGLGLSLAYDIVKAHGGELKVESVENEGSTFFLQLPIKPETL